MMRIKKGFLLILVPLFCSLIPGGFAFGQSTHKVTRSGDLFPPHTFPAPTSWGDLNYFGLSEEKPFTLGDIQADLVVLELINIYCTSCQEQGPIYNEVFDLVKKDPITKDKVKWVGVGVGNNETEVEFFRREKGIPFPVLPDFHFNLYKAIGGPGGVRTPFTLLIRKDKKGRGIVVASHTGFRGNKRELLDEIKAALQYDLAYLNIEKGKRMVLPAAAKLKPPIADEELLKKIKEGMPPPGGVVKEIRRIPPKEQYLYVGKVEVKAEKKHYFAKVASWPPFCDICHDIHFIYVFDEEAKITNLIPVHLPKGYNKVWNERDIEAMKNRLIGRSLLKPFEFNHHVDAVSGATITSMVIFYRLNEGKKAYTRLMKHGYVK